MKKDKLFHLFYSLSPREVKAFKTYVIGRKPQKISSLVEILAKNKTTEDDQNHEKIRQKAFKKLFPNDKNNTQNYRRLVTDTLSLLCDFLILQQTKSDPATRQGLLREQYKNRTLPDLFEATLSDGIKRLKEQPEKDFTHYNALTKLLNEKIFYQKGIYEETEAFEEALTGIQHALDMGYFISKLHYACQIKIWRIISNLPSIKFELEEAFYKHLQPYTKDPVIIFFTRTLQLAEDPNKEDYLNLKAHWIKHLDLFSENLKLQTFIYLTNLCWFSINQNDRVQAIYDLYSFAVEKKLLLNSGYISTHYFNNYIDICTSLKKYDEIRAFIKEYVPYLRESKDEKKNIQNLYDAFLLFGIQEYDQALMQSSILQFKHFSFGLRSYVLVIKCLYETKKAAGLEEIDTRCTAFKQYLHRKYKEGHINKLQYDSNVNFTKIVLLLPSTSSSRFATVSPDQLLEKIEAMDYLVSKAWLLEKVEELR